MPRPDFAAVCAEFAAYDLVLFFYEGGGRPLRQLLAAETPQRIAIVTGSEGGFAPRKPRRPQPPGR